MSVKLAMYPLFLHLHSTLNFISMINSLSDLSVQMEGLSTPPHLITSEDDYRTPQNQEILNQNTGRALFTFAPPPSYSLIATLRHVRLYHTSYCPEGGLCKRFKGLTEDEPKGLYCCANIAFTHEQVKRLQPLENNVLIYDMRTSILLGETSPHVAGRILGIIKGLNTGDLLSQMSYAAS